MHNAAATFSAHCSLPNNHGSKASAGAPSHGQEIDTAQNYASERKGLSKTAVVEAQMDIPVQLAVPFVA